MKHAILCVDDEIDNVDALERIFRRDYKVHKAISGDEGLALLKEHSDIALIISDQRMPGMTGVEMLAQSIETHPETIRILLTGYTDMDSVVESINSGHVYRYLTKPWDPVDLKNTVDKAIEKFELRRELVHKNKELKKALDELQVLDQSKNNFMILINHELKTPLTVLSSFWELLKETKLTKDQTKYVDRIGQSSEKLQKIIDDVLMLVSAETGITKTSKRKVAFKNLLKDLEEPFIESMEKKKVSINAETSSLAFKADQQLITEVLHRVVDNAIKFSEEGSDITIKAEEVDEKIQLSIVNKGKAIPKKTIDKILKPFSLDEDIMNHTQGLGIGLSLSQAILKLHDSQLSIDCPKGHVKVHFTLDKA